MALRERIEADLKTALRERRGEEVGTLRLLIAAMHNEAILKRKKDSGLDEEEEQQVLRREAKKREEAAREFVKAGRKDRSAQEEQEAVIIHRYLPQELSDEALEGLIRQELGGVVNVGELMKRVMPKMKGRASGDRVRKIAEGLLSKS